MQRRKCCWLIQTDRAEWGRETKKNMSTIQLALRLVVAAQRGIWLDFNQNNEAKAEKRGWRRMPAPAGELLVEQHCEQPTQPPAFWPPLCPDPIETTCVITVLCVSEIRDANGSKIAATAAAATTTMVVVDVNNNSMRLFDLWSSHTLVCACVCVLLITTIRPGVNLHTDITIARIRGWPMYTISCLFNRTGYFLSHLVLP